MQHFYTQPFILAVFLIHNHSFLQYSLYTTIHSCSIPYTQPFILAGFLIHNHSFLQHFLYTTFILAVCLIHNHSFLQYSLYTTIHSCSIYLTEHLDHGCTSSHKNGIKIKILIFIFYKFLHLLTTVFTLYIFVVILQALHLLFKQQSTDQVYKTTELSNCVNDLKHKIQSSLSLIQNISGKINHISNKFIQFTLSMYINISCIC